jgi:hypothetical protein
LAIVETNQPQISSNKTSLQLTQSDAWDLRLVSNLSIMILGWESKLLT